jgi:1-acyl-sn-glycerol-3-phosphate acyltransferase
MRTVRRITTVPLVVLVEVALLLASPFLLGITAVTSAVVRSSRPLRSMILVLVYAAVELSLLWRLAEADRDWDALARNTLRTAYRALKAILDVPLVLEDGSATATDLAASRGLVVLARHCGPGDSLFIAWLLAVRYGLRLHVVLTARLRLQPTIDLASDHLPFCFVRRGGARTRARVREFAASMSAGDALLLFPEGGNFSWPRWHRAMAALTASGAQNALLQRFRRRTHTLPPHLGGPLAALTGAPEADVLLLMHTGFAADGRARPWWRLPVHREIVMRTELVPRASLPADVAGWLDEAWARIDAWVANRVSR